MKKKHTFLIISLIFVAVAAALAVGAYIYYANQFRDRFFKGTVINGMDVSGLTADEVEHMIENNADRSYNLTVTFRDGKSETITADDIRYRYESDGSVQKLMDEQDPYAWVQAFLHPETRDVQVPMVYDEDLLEEKISSLPELQEENMTAPTDALIRSLRALALSLKFLSSSGFFLRDRVEKSIASSKQAIRSRPASSSRAS